jgi:chromosome segregation ATPase
MMGSSGVAVADEAESSALAHERFSLVLALLQFAYNPGAAGVLAALGTADPAVAEDYRNAAALLRVASDPEASKVAVEQLAEAAQAHAAREAALAGREERVSGLEATLKGLADREAGLVAREAEAEARTAKLVAQITATERLGAALKAKEQALTERESAVTKDEKKLGIVRARIEQKEAAVDALRRRIGEAMA